MDELDPTYQAPSIASTPEQRTRQGGLTHFELIGGDAGISELVERFYHHMETLPEAASIRAMHPPDLAPVKTVLERYLTEWMGGPPVYSVERGHPRLRRRHLGFPIGPQERDAWLSCMRAALEETVENESLRQELNVAFEKTADFLRNDTQHVHRHHNTNPPAK